MASIREVAKMADVSPATVSRVINGTAKVSAERMARVLECISATGYVSDEIAKNLFKKSSKLIGVIVPSIQNPYFTQLASAIEALVAENGYRMFLCDARDDSEKEEAAIRTLVAMDADGIIITSANEQIGRYLSMCQIPVVAVDTVFSNQDVLAYICSDYYNGGRLATEHLLECGCRNIVCIKGPQHFYSAKSSYEGYRDVCNERRMRIQALECDHDFSMGPEIVEMLFDRYPHADGIFAWSDVAALSVCQILYQRNIKVPEQVQVVGFNNTMWSNLFVPTLTTVAQPIQEIAAEAVELIMNAKSNKGKGRTVVYPVNLFIRETTKAKF